MDRRSGKDYSHRKEWIRERMEQLDGIFSLDISPTLAQSQEVSEFFKDFVLLAGEKPISDERQDAANYSKADGIGANRVLFD